MKTSPNPMLIMRLFAVISLAFLTSMLAPQACSQGMNDIQWLSSVDQAKELAKRQNKLVLLHFGAEWCRPCKALETYVFRAGAVKKAIAENVVPVKLDADTALALVNEYDVSMVPFDVIITPQGRVVSERRSPADADNYAKMIASTSTASRTLGKEKHGPIAHQQVIRNRTLAGQDPLEFRSKGPEVETFGLSKDGSMLQRRQTAFAKDSNAVRKSNPFLAGAAQPAAEEQPVRDQQTVSVEDLQRDEFLSREREWTAPVEKTRRAKPERIVNDRYFEKFSERPRSTQPPININSTKASTGYVPAAQAVYTPPVATPSQPQLHDQLALTSSTSPVAVDMPTLSQQPSARVATAQPVPVAPAAPAVSMPASVTMPVSDESFELSLEDSSEIALEPADQLIPPPLSNEGFKFEEEPNPIVEVDSPDMMEVASAAQPPTDRSRFSLKGKCPVTLITEGRWEDGDTRYGIVHRNRTYVFASAQALALFRTNPDKYSPILAGYDPVIFHEQGQLVNGLVENGVFMGRTPEQRVILFANQQTRTKFQSSPLVYMDTIRTATQQAGQGVIIR